MGKTHTCTVLLPTIEQKEKKTIHRNVCYTIITHEVHLPERSELGYRSTLAISISFQEM